MTDEKSLPDRRLRRVLIILFMLGAILVGLAIWFARKFTRDRQSAMNFESHPISIRRQQTNGQPVTRTYTQKEIEEARKKGKPLPGLSTPPAIPPGGQAGDDAVQRSLRTLNEINRINEMNRKLTEQQQRQNR